MATIDQSSVTADNVSWTAVVPPDNYDNVLIDNTQGSDVLKIRRQSGVAQEITVAAGGERLLAPPRPHTSGVDFRFPSGTNAFFVQYVSGSATVNFVWA